jgi:hypothetical protein
MLLGDKVETVSVDSAAVAGVSTAAVLAADTGYVAVASGTWTNQSGANVVDAEYSSADAWTTVMDGYTGYQTDILELQINNEFDPASDWGAYNSNHRYAQAFTMAAPGTANFRVFDGAGVTVNESWYNDNAGSLLVDVYPGYMGVTGENGCVTFTDVPYGTYVVDEIMQDGWTASVVPETVTVDTATETVNLVNRDLAYVPPCELTIVSDTGTVVEETNTYAVAITAHENWTAEIDGATWIWEAATVADPQATTTRTFVETFTIASATSGMIDVAADNGYLLYVNGTLVADRSEPLYPNNFQTHTQNDYNILPYLVNGTNTVEVVVTNTATPGSNSINNPAGALFKIEVVGLGNCARTTAVAPVIDGDDEGDGDDVVIPVPEEENEEQGGGTRILRNAPRGQVLGASTTALQCVAYLRDYMRQATVNDPEQVLKLQIFLNAVGLTTPVTKVFDTDTDRAVRAFQEKYASDVLAPWGLTDPTGYVYKTTRWKINNIVCPGSEAYPTLEI